LAREMCGCCEFWLGVHGGHVVSRKHAGAILFGGKPIPPAVHLLKSIDGLAISETALVRATFLKREVCNKRGSDQKGFFSYPTLFAGTARVVAFRLGPTKNFDEDEERVNFIEVN